MRELNRLRAIILYSLNRPLSLVAIAQLILGVGLGLFVLDFSVEVVSLWSAFCGGLLVATTVDTLFDPEKRRDAARACLDPSAIHDQTIRDKVKKAFGYVRSAHGIMRGAKAGQLASVASDIPALDTAAKGIFEVSVRLDRYRRDYTLRCDLASLRWLGGNLSDSQQRYLQTLFELDILMKEASAQVDNALAEIGRSYASIQGILVKPEFLGGAANSFARVREVTLRLDDLSTSFDEVYNRRTIARE